MNIIKPAHLKDGATIGIIATSGAIEQSAFPIVAAVDFFEKKGYKTLVNNDVYKKDRYLAGDDATRLKNIHASFENDKIDAIICLRGGYGALRLINKIDYSVIRNNPKIFCGFSDVTALNLMFYKRAGLISYSGPMIASDFGNIERSDFTTNEFFKALKNDNYTIEGEHIFKKGFADGILWGGNLSTIVSLCGQDFIPNEPFIFFAEDIGEPVYKIDKMFTQLLNIEKFRKNIKALCLGDFSFNDSDAWLIELFKELTLELRIPTVTGFKFSHSPHKATVPIGAKAKLQDKTLFIE